MMPKLVAPRYGDKLERGTTPATTPDKYGMVDVGTDKLVKKIAASLDRTCVMLTDEVHAHVRSLSLSLSLSL